MLGTSEIIKNKYKMCPMPVKITEYINEHINETEKLYKQKKICCATCFYGYYYQKLVIGRAGKYDCVLNRGCLVPEYNNILNDRYPGWRKNYNYRYKNWKPFTACDSMEVIIKNIIKDEDFKI